VSGILGLYYLDGQPAIRSDLETMMRSLAHRGPDGSNIWSEGAVGLGHQMLWTTIESLREVLPLANRREDVVVTADARIDNREELINLLGLERGLSESISDSELILAAYEEWGEGCVERLLGDFAFAVWDARKRALFCGRDRFGVKPFYYYSSPTLFAFASEIKALLSLREIPRRLNEMMVANYLAADYEDKVSTFYKEINRLPPSCVLSVSREGASSRQYYRLDPDREAEAGSDDEYAERFRDLFTRAVRCRLRSAFPVGSMLSGGLDSSSIACVARNLMVENGAKLHTFSAIFDEVSQCDERVFQQAVLAQGGIEPHTFHADKVSPLADMDRVLWHQDQVHLGTNLYVSWGLCGLAKEQSVRVLLDGFDGDTTVSHGTGYLYELARAGRWLALARELRGYTANITGEPWIKALYAWISRYAINPAISRSASLTFIRRAWRKLGLTGARARQPAKASILNPYFVERIRFAQHRQSSHKSSPKTEREHHYRRLTWSVMPSTLESLDRVGAAFSIDLRFPFWDNRLVEFCLGLPPEQKMRRGLTRMILRRAMSDILPPEILCRRGKSDLSSAFGHGMLLFEQRRIKELILNDLAIIEPYIDKGVLREIYNRYESRQAGESDMVTVWSAAMLTRWLQHTGLTP
jgi:asparagine synthase (glutamine-hydrolysing)